MIRHILDMMVTAGKAMALRCLILLSILPAALQAQNTDSWQWKGLFSADHRMLIRQDQTWAWNETRLDLGLSKRSANINIHANAWFRHLGPSTAASSAELRQKDKVYSPHINIREVYAEIYDFLIPGLDLKIGRQFINWGKADRINPTNTLNAFDLEDVLDFGRQNPDNALSIHWHFGQSWSLQAVALPMFRPANMPLGYFASLFQHAISLPDHFTLNEYSDELLLPDNTLMESGNAGIRLRGFVLNTDFSLSYTYGRNSLPMAHSVTLSPAEQGVNVQAILLFPRQHVLGADLAGSIWHLGAWAELAVILPEKEITTSVDMSALYPPDTPANTILYLTSLKKEPYTRFVAGTDYTFKNGTYFNLQYVYGFFHESGRDNTTDYLLINLEKNVMQNKLLLRPLAGGANIADWSDIGNNYAIFLNPQISYLGTDNLNISAGAFLFYGKGSGLFAQMKQAHMFTLLLQLAF